MYGSNGCKSAAANSTSYSFPLPNLPSLFTESIPMDNLFFRFLNLKLQVSSSGLRPVLEFKLHPRFHCEEADI